MSTEANEINSAPITPRRSASAALTPPAIASPPMSLPPSQFHSPSLSRWSLLHPEDSITTKMSAEANEINSAPITPRPVSVASTPPVMASPPVSCPPSQFHSPSLSRSPLLHPENAADAPTPSKTPRTPRTPRISLTPRFITPLGSPMRKALRLTKLDPQDAWLPITESRNGNKYYAAFHTLCSGIGVQALVLPVAFTILGWTWGIISLTVAFVWQLYTLWLLVQLHESTETGIRYCRYLQLCGATFGEKLGKLFALLPIMYLSAGTCTALIIIGGSTAKTFFQIVCGATCSAKPLTTVEWYLVFTCAAVVLSQLPNLNSIAGVSLIGAITAVGYCTMIWAISVGKGRLPGVSYDPIKAKSDVARIFSVLNAFGIIAFAFRGHNLILEIQSTMPSSEKHPSHVPMWKGVKVAYTLIAACLFPLAIGGYWAYGHLIPANGGMLTALYQFHSQDVSKFVLGLTSVFVIVNAVSSFQIYGMPMFDDMESAYTTKAKKPCPWWLRSVFRTIFGFVCFFVAVAIPFLASLAGLIGGLALPVTLAYPCFMWLKIKKPKKYNGMWWLNWFLGISGMSLSGILIAAGIYVVIDTGVEISFFNPQ
ncbi:lysine histidine transporter-like 8 [Quillaja saponaria]|uniref:Lysine histidine transporter-like 8 n=1 Tax=Quillaja saponaria TaxID=32244 RepID=A0AAD7L8J3_QUISA|nr:lysine histidine transporter-like 8 [Quillaja saponaria]